ncbi:MAG: hypothetical protein NTZ97_01050 [Candidatus Moranbacteria bacterium]|nr:hypothetical protein [Candidatus Moranbacteria bacterium]
MNIQLDKIKNLFKNLPIFIRKRRKLILFSIFLLLLGCSAYQWYRYVYNFGWSEAKKQEYINSKEKMTTFDEEKFNQVIQEIEKRKAEEKIKIENIPNIFNLK